MTIEESKIVDLITRYEGYQEECLDAGGAVNSSRAGLYRTMIKDLESLLPRKSIADLGVSDYDDLTGTIVEYGGKRGVLLGGSDDLAMSFTFSDRYVNWSDPHLVFPLDEDRVWDETGIVL